MPHPYRFDAADWVWRPPADAWEKAPWSVAAVAVPGRSGRPEGAAIVPSVITSCSTRGLPYLFAEVGGVDDMHRFDLFMFREADLRSIRLWLETSRPNLFARLTGGDESPFETTAGLLGRELGPPLRAEVRAALVEWVSGQCQPLCDRGFRFAAMATFLPDLSSFRNRDRLAARRAVVECVLLALDLEAAVPGLMPQAVVEVVCGSLTDRCYCPVCEAERVCFVGDELRKRRTFVGELAAVVAGVLAARPDARFALAVELEPGETYLVRDTATRSARRPSSTPPAARSCCRGMWG